MKSRTYEKALAFAMLIGMGIGCGFAHDLVVPCWRGQPGTTFQNWEFNTGLDPATPESSFNPDGTAQAAITLTPSGEGWKASRPAFGNQTGTWDLGSDNTGTDPGKITLAIPNQNGSSASSCKHIWLQITEFYDGFFFSGYATPSISGATQIGSTERQLVESTPPFGGWYVSSSKWRLAPSPGSETILITGSSSGGLVDEIVVDTLTLDYPAPANISVAGDTSLHGKTVSWTPTSAGCLSVAYKTNGVLADPAGSFFQYGVTTVIQEVADSYGLPQTNTFTVSVSNPSPTFATVGSFVGQWHGDRVTLAWTTVGEFWTLGYNVYAEGANGAMRRVNARLIPGSGNMPGGSYAIEDTAVQPPVVVTYWLEEVDCSLIANRYDRPVVFAQTAAGVASTRMTKQGLQLTFCGRVGTDYEVQATDDLASGGWALLATATAQTNPDVGGGINPSGGSTGQFTVLDPAALQKPMRFYRAWSR